MTVYEELLRALLAIKPHGLNPPVELVLQLARVGTRLKDEHLDEMAKLTDVLVLSLFPEQPGENPRPQGLDKCVAYWMQQLWEACEAEPKGTLPKGVH